MRVNVPVIQIPPQTPDCNQGTPFEKRNLSSVVPRCLYPWERKGFAENNTKKGLN